MYEVNIYGEGFIDKKVFYTLIMARTLIDQYIGTDVEWFSLYYQCQFIDRGYYVLD